ncbi:PPM-type phosphatase domain-containing protein [Plasmodiophora brassicae]|uniref:PPM-type phosphatase domain-containing protein n=1 Tax=Plasmodiophora brassicae TaxID=37360 RepID=A0A3P3YKH8_PLABS|nr:unnamed protein product [Plasmodiophora brassicae]
MGLAHPVACKAVYNVAHPGVVAGVGSMQGYRVSMEDTHSLCVPLRRHPNTHLLAVFDGHGGSAAAQFAEREIARNVDLLDVIEEAGVRRVIMEADSRFLAESNQSCKQGACLVMAVVTASAANGEWDVLCVNVGDSRILVGTVPGSAEHEIDCRVMTVDHKPEVSQERERIVNAGGSVVMGRIDRTLAVSRALGDWVFKSNDSLPPDEQKVVSVPEFTRTTVGCGAFLLVACDGIFEAMSSAQVASFVGRDLAETSCADPAMTVARLLDASLRSGSKDNMTCIVACFVDADGVPVERRFVHPEPLPNFEAMRQVDRVAFCRAYLSFAESYGFRHDAEKVLSSHGFDVAHCSTLRKRRHKGMQMRERAVHGLTIAACIVAVIAVIMAFTRLTAIYPT